MESTGNHPPDPGSCRGGHTYSYHLSLAGTNEETMPRSAGAAVIADASPIPVLMYNVTKLCGSTFHPGGGILSEHPNIVG